MSIRSALLAAIIASIMSIGSALAQQPLTDAELHELVVGKSLLWSSGNITEYQADGRYSFKAGSGKIIAGKYSISGNKLCYVAATGSAACDEFYRDLQGPYNLASNGRQYRFTIGTLGAQPVVSQPVGLIRTCEGRAVSASRNLSKLRFRLAFDTDSNARMFVYVDDSSARMYWGVIALQYRNGKIHFSTISSQTGSGYEWTADTHPESVWPVKGVYTEEGTTIWVTFHCT